MKTAWRWWQGCRARARKLATNKLASQFVLSAEKTKRFADAMKQASEHIKLLQTNMMKNLLDCDGRRFRCKIEGMPVTGKVRVEDGIVYLCQNKLNGNKCEDRLGYKCSWSISDGSAESLELRAITDFQLLSMTAEEIEAYKDWQVGDIICDGLTTREVIFRSGELVVCKELKSIGLREKGDATGNYTCDELYRMGYRLVPDPVSEEKEIVEVTMNEIAEKMGVPVERLRVKKEE